MEVRHLRVGEAEQSRDDAHWKGKGELAHELRAAAFDESVDVLVDDRGDRLDLPAFHRLAAERLLDDAAVVVVLGFVHLEDGVSHDLAHHVLVALRGERVPVAQDGLHCVERERGEYVGEVAEELRVDEPGLVLALDLEAGHRPHVLLDERCGRPGELEHRIGILDDPDARAAVELLERVVLGRFDGRHRGPPDVQRSARVALTIASVRTDPRGSRGGCERERGRRWTTASARAC